MALSGEHARNVNHPSGGSGAREAALTRRIRQLEQRVFALEETLHQADQLRKKTAEEALVAKYGESVDKSLAARIMGVTRSTVYAMIADGRVESAVLFGFGVPIVAACMAFVVMACRMQNEENAKLAAQQK